MPRKPSSVYVIVEQPNVQTGPAMPGAALGATSLQVWRVPLEDDDTIERVVERTYTQHPIGSTVVAIEDTKVQAFTVGITLTEIDDPRLDQDEDEETDDGLPLLR